MCILSGSVWLPTGHCDILHSNYGSALFLRSTLEMMDQSQTCMEQHEQVGHWKTLTSQAEHLGDCPGLTCVLSSFLKRHALYPYALYAMYTCTQNIFTTSDEHYQYRELLALQCQRDIGKNVTLCTKVIKPSTNLLSPIKPGKGQCISLNHWILMSGMKNER